MFSRYPTLRQLSPNTSKEIGEHMRILCVPSKTGEGVDIAA